MKILLWTCLAALISSQAHAQGTTPRNLPRLPTSGIQGSLGAGFTDFVIINPAAHFRLERGSYAAAQVERGFGVMNLYFTMTLSQMNASGTAKYKYTNLSSSATYTANGVGFNASLLDLALGFKLKLIDGYWFRPYVEGGGVGSYHQLRYTSKSDELNGQGSDWKSGDVMMGSGYYGEAGIEVQFASFFGIKFAARYSEQQTKEMITQNNEKLRFRAETYYLSALLNF